ncbi:IS3 family transposase [Sphingopyxis sp.]|uniref:IS3 family transposase n=1 Tax=Sphingopyxis sp. TaxID=1908224 RepID=UPI003BABF4F0
MKPKSSLKKSPPKAPAERVVKDIRRATRRHFSAEDKIRIVLEGLRGEDSIAELCRKEGIAQSLYYTWSKEFMEAGKRRLAGDTARAATTGEVHDLRREARALKECVADLTLENRLLKKHDRGWGRRRMRYPASEKLEIIRIVEQSHLPTRHTLDQLGIARRTFYRWYDRFLEGGPEALEDRPSAPSRVWNRIGDDIQDQIVEMALDYSELSPRELAVRFTDEKRYFVSEATVYRLLKAHDLITSPAYIVIKAADQFHTKTTRVNEMWQTDFTYFKIIGWGWMYLSTVLDDFSRYIIAWKLCTNMRAEDVTDTLDLALEASGCDSATVHPQTQGKIERWHQTLKNRILLENYFLPGDLEAQIEAFVEHYNHRRYHESLNNVTPADAYFGRADAIIKQRERIKRKTIEHRRLLHRKIAA